MAATTIVEYLLRLKAEGQPVLKEVAQDAEAAAKATDKASSANEKFGDTAGRVGQNAAKLAGGLGLIDEGAASAALAVADVADIGEVAATVTTALGISMSSLLAVLAPVAVAVAALGAVYVVLNGELKDAEAKQKAAADQAERATKIYGDLKKAVSDLDTAYKVTTGQMSEAAAQAEAARQKVEETFAPALAEQQGVINGLRIEIQARRDNYAALVQEEGSKDAVAKATNSLVAQLDTEVEKYNALVEKKNENLEKADLMVAAGVKERRAREDATKAAEREREELERLREAEALLTEQRAEATAAAVAREAAEAALEPIIAATYTAQEKVKAAYRADMEAVNAAIDAGADYEIVLAAKNAAIEKYADGMRKAREEQQALTAAEAAGDRAGVERASDAVGMAAGGPQAVLGAVASSGPWGSLIAGIIEIVGNFEDLGDQFNDVTMAFNQSIGNLPDMLGENLGRWIETGTQSAIDMVPAFIQGLADNLPQIISSILESLVTMTGALLKAVFVEIPKAFGSLIETLTAKETWQAIWDGLVQALEEAIRELFGTKENGEGKLFNQGGILDQVFVGRRERENGTEGPGLFGKGGWFDTAGQDIASFVGSFATGTDGITRTGLALVHQGERIVPATGAGSGTTSAMMAGGAGGVTYVLPQGLLWGTPEHLAREVGRARDRGVAWGGA